MIARIAIAAVSLLAFCSSAHAECVACPSARQIQIQDQKLRETVSTALLEAFDRLDSDACRLAFGGEHELSAVRLAQLRFIDGSQDASCRTSNLYAKVPLDGTEVTVCPRFAGRKPAQRVAILIHEAFHSTGVSHADGPDGSRAVTARVADRCK